MQQQNRGQRPFCDLVCSYLDNCGSFSTTVKQFYLMEQNFNIIW